MDGRGRHNTRRTEDDLATIKDADKFVARCFIMIDFDEFYSQSTTSEYKNAPPSSGIGTLLCEHHKAFASLPLGNIEMFLVYPPKQGNSLR